MCKYSFKILVKNKGSGDFVCLCVYTDIHLSSLFVEKPITYPLDFGVFSHNQSKLCICGSVSGIHPYNSETVVHGPLES
jgi:hypothetical protein